MSSMLRCVAAVNSSSAFPGARCVASRTRPLKCTRPSPSAAKIAGQPRPIRATRIRFLAASSDRRSSPIQ